jgi:hypothetical protein
MAALAYNNAQIDKWIASGGNTPSGKNSIV